MKRKFFHRLCDWLWNLFCFVSIVGIWPRWIEPRILRVKKKKFSIDPRLKGLKIAFFSDLHLQRSTPEALLTKILKKTEEFKPDLVLFAGDFLCYSRLECKDRFLSFFNGFSAPLGCFAVLGNHDYDQSGGLNTQQEYDLIEPGRESFVVAGMKRLFTLRTPSGVFSANLKRLGLHQELHEYIRKTPFQLLQNETVQCEYKGNRFNITGLGEYSLNMCNVDLAMQNYDRTVSGVILAHNPDAIKLLKDLPGDFIFSGHTHGGQVNLPWLWKRVTILENRNLKQGFIRWNNKNIYVTRGVGSIFTFRLFSPPEVVLLTLE